MASFCSESETQQEMENESSVAVRASEAPSNKTLSGS